MFYICAGFISSHITNIYMKLFATASLLLIILLLGCKSDPKPSTTSKGSTKATSTAKAILFKGNHPVLVDKLPALAQRIALEKQVLSQKPAIIQLSKSNLQNPKLFFAQALAINNKDFTSQCALPETKEPILSEIMSIHSASVKELRQEKLGEPLIVVDMYNYFYNSTVKAFIDEKSRTIKKIVHRPGHVPALRPKMKTLAQQIALQYPFVQEQLGVKDVAAIQKMDIVVRDSKCERSRHLCAAVTVTPPSSQKTLWVLVDMTVHRAIGAQWMPLWNPNRPKLVTERSLQNDVISESLCGKMTRIELGKWVINYQLTNSDGIEIKDVVFDGHPVIASAKLVDWHVSYPNKKGFGYSDAMGCPKFSSAAVVAFEPPDIQPIRAGGVVIGYSFVQDFRSPVWPKGCNYRYQNLFEFYNDGRFRIAGINLGLGCSNNGWYRPVFRIHLAAKTTTEIWAGEWTQWTQEQWHLQNKKTPYSPKGYLFRFQDQSGNGYYLEPNQGQFGDGSHGDSAYTYVSVHHPAEGDDDMGVIGPCCNKNENQGPEKFIIPAEPLSDNPVIWYVPQMKNNDQKGQQYCWVESYVKDGHEGFKTYPGIVGPMFVPITNK